MHYIYKTPEDSAPGGSGDPRCALGEGPPRHCEGEFNAWNTKRGGPPLAIPPMEGPPTGAGGNPEAQLAIPRGGIPN